MSLCNLGETLLNHSVCSNEYILTYEYLAIDVLSSPILATFADFLMAINTNSQISTRRLSSNNNNNEPGYEVLDTLAVIGLSRRGTYFISSYTSSKVRKSDLVSACQLHSPQVP
jgi:hypothetical protein